MRRVWDPTTGGGVNMNYQEISECCISKLGAALDYPFGPDSDLFKVGCKVFALLAEDDGYTKVTSKVRASAC